MGESVTVQLDPDEVVEIRRPVNGQGGMQDLLRELQGRLTSIGTIQISAEEIERIKRYAGSYGEGGFQNRLRLILEKLG